MDSSRQNNLKIRSYTSSDREACLALFDSNAPQYFAVSDRPQFEAFLDHPEGAFLIGEIEENGVVACGGWYIDVGQSLAGLTWGTVKRSSHRCGYGQALLDARIGQIRRDGRARIARVRTTQLVQGFFERNGFVQKRIVKDGFGNELDLVEMELVLS